MQALTSRIEASVEKTKGAVEKTLESAAAAPASNEAKEEKGAPSGGSWTQFDMEEGEEQKEAAEKPSLLEDEEDLLGLRQPMSEAAAFGGKEATLIDTSEAAEEAKPNGGTEATLLGALEEPAAENQGSLLQDIDSFLGIGNDTTAKEEAKKEPKEEVKEEAKEEVKEEAKEETKEEANSGGGFGFGDPEASLFDDKDDGGFATRR